MDRNSILLAGLDRDLHSGAEIGPFFAPIAPKRGGWNTIVVDAYDTETLVNKAVNHDSPEIRSHSDHVETVDVVWSGEDLGAIPGLVANAPLDYIIASHVIEHVPDIIRFLQGADSLLGETGVLSLAVPDSRFCFDALRFPSTSGEAARAYREGRTRISPETLYEQMAFGVFQDHKGAWRKDSSGSLSLMSTFAHSTKAYNDYVLQLLMPDSDYVDCHAWVFTPTSFELMILELQLLGLITLQVSNMNLETLGSEFFVKLQRIPNEIQVAVLEGRRLELMLKVRSELSNVSRREAWS